MRRDLYSIHRFLHSSKAQTISVNDSVAVLPPQLYALSITNWLTTEKVKFEKIPGRCINFGLTGNEFYYAVFKLNAVKLDKTDLPFHPVKKPILQQKQQPHEKNPFDFVHFINNEL